MHGVNLLVFRGDRRRVCGYTLKAALIEQLRLLCGDNSRERLTLRFRMAVRCYP